jgi:predicted RNase H-like nuclease (RuvC/YqgF family)
MSLTRYAQNHRGDWITHEGGGWVQAEEAEARIKKQSADIACKGREIARLDSVLEEKQARIKELELVIGTLCHEASKDDARIKELEAECAAWKIADESWVRRVKELEAALETEARLRVKDCEERNAYKARLRAADELADAAEPAIVYLTALAMTCGVGVPLAKAHTAYREAGSPVEKQPMKTAADAIAHIARVSIEGAGK